MKAFYNREYFCDHCVIAYTNAYKHNCEHICKSCKRQRCIDIYNNKNKCEKCNYIIKNESCFEIHNSTYCIALKMCDF